jgi:putative alpha-1,2-mannosidase
MFKRVLILTCKGKLLFLLIIDLFMSLKMQKNFTWLFLFIIINMSVLISHPHTKELISYVNPFIGTSNGGNTFPGAVVPWGMVSVSPHNSPGAPSGYISGGQYFYGFGHTHLSGTGCADLHLVRRVPRLRRSCSLCDGYGRKQ